MSEIESAYNAMMCGSIYDCVKWIRLSAHANHPETMTHIANLIESEINVRNDQIAALKKELEAERGIIVGFHKLFEKANQIPTWACGHTCYGSCWECNKKDLELARAERDRAILEGRGGWIKCSERLPDSDGYFTVWDIGFGACPPSSTRAFFNLGRWDGIAFHQSRISHWKPLPSPPANEEPPKDDRSEDEWFQDPNEGDRS